MSEAADSATVYAPEVFVRDRLEEARAIILTPEVGLTTDQRWERETAWLAERLILPPGLTLDIGCGVGRLAKILVSRDSSVLGVDISPSMRAMSEAEVASPGRFSAVSPGFLNELVSNGLRAQSAIAIWVLQHVPIYELTPLIPLIAEAMPRDAPFWILERGDRLIPAMSKDGFVWCHDSGDVTAILSKQFELSTEEPVPDDLCQSGAVLSMWMRK